MKRRIIFASLTGTIVATGAVATVGIASRNFLHPDVTGRPTAELRHESLELWKRHLDSPLPVKVFAALRHQHISDELTRRVPAELDDLTNPLATEPQKEAQ
jgi:hypothetical protein